jgi:hypothetical protein
MPQPQEKTQPVRPLSQAAHQRFSISLRRTASTAGYRVTSVNHSYFPQIMEMENVFNLVPGAHDDQIVIVMNAESLSFGCLLACGGSAGSTVKPWMLPAAR